MVVSHSVFLVLVNPTPYRPFLSSNGQVLAKRLHHDKSVQSLDDEVRCAPDPLSRRTFTRARGEVSSYTTAFFTVFSTVDQILDAKQCDP
jgi:hypothetical protein